MKAKENIFNTAPITPPTLFSFPNFKEIKEMIAPITPIKITAIIGITLVNIEKITIIPHIIPSIPKLFFKIDIYLPPPLFIFLSYTNFTYFFLQICPKIYNSFVGTNLFR